MNTDNILFKDNRDFDHTKLYRLFIKEKWNDYMDPEDVQFHIEKAVYVITAWYENDLIGYGRIEGDGRIIVEISDVLIRSDCRNKGIGSRIVSLLMDHIKKLDPYYVQVTPCGKKEMHLYEKFGFTVIPDYIRMEAMTVKLEEKIARVRSDR
jgi:GNAT superfamily N-acetyltransferase